MEGCHPHVPEGQFRGMSGTAKKVSHSVVGGAAIGADAEVWSGVSSQSHSFTGCCERLCRALLRCPLLWRSFCYGASVRWNQTPPPLAAMVNWAKVIGYLSSKLCLEETSRPTAPKATLPGQSSEMGCKEWASSYIISAFRFGIMTELFKIAGGRVSHSVAREDKRSIW